jgi:L-alanine-DL-glutamate epimerase-like enolase superfamily enzyme
MKIIEIRTHRLTGGTVDGGWSRAHQPHDDLHTLLEVVAEDGTVGLGSVFTSSALVDAGIAQLEHLWRGASALEPQCVSELLRQSSFWQGRGGTLEHVISGIEIALWDLLGKTCGQPIWRLWGGAYRRRIKPYASLLFAEPDLLKERLQATTARGFRAIKLGWRPFGRVNNAYDELLVRTARDTVGPDVELMVDAGGSEEFWPHGYKWALGTARMLADYDITWFEEPLCPDDIEGYRHLTEHAPVHIAGGEVLTRRQSFLPWLQTRAVDIIQPDATKCGGIGEARRIAHLAEDHHVGFVSHGWNTAVGLAADMQLAANLPVAHYVEYLTPAPYIDNLLAEPLKLDAEGLLAIPDGPGLGIELDREALARFAGG